MVSHLNHKHQGMIQVEIKIHSFLNKNNLKKVKKGLVMMLPVLREKDNNINIKNPFWVKLSRLKICYLLDSLVKHLEATVATLS